jgi:hypothetical protein
VSDTPTAEQQERFKWAANERADRWEAEARYQYELRTSATKALRRLVEAVTTLQTVDDDGETAEFWTVPPEPLELAHEVLSRADAVPALSGDSGPGLTEVVACAIYDAMREADPEGRNHPWVPGGNSRKQEEARRRARTALAAAPVPDTAPLDVLAALDDIDRVLPFLLHDAASDPASRRDLATAIAARLRAAEARQEPVR